MSDIEVPNRGSSVFLGKTLLQVLKPLYPHLYEIMPDGSYHFRDSSLHQEMFTRDIVDASGNVVKKALYWYIYESKKAQVKMVKPEDIQDIELDLDQLTEPDLPE